MAAKFTSIGGITTGLRTEMTAIEALLQETLDTLFPKTYGGSPMALGPAAGLQFDKTQDLIRRLQGIGVDPNDPIPGQQE